MPFASDKARSAERRLLGRAQLFRWNLEPKLEFSVGDVMDLGLVAGVISESFGNVALAGVKPVEGCEPPSGTKAVENTELHPAQSSNGREHPGDHRLNTLIDTIRSETAMPESSAPPSMVLSLAAPALFWRALKSAWTGSPRGK